jgi:SAM-dependent methyltransferase
VAEKVTYEIAPGSILQRMFLTERLSHFAKPGMTFVELGSGNGYNSNLLLASGMSGTGIDLNLSACENNKELNAYYIDNKRYSVSNGDFFSFIPAEKVDLLFSCMVIEHMPEEMVKAYFTKAKEIVKPGGRIITMVPGSMKHWGIEDEIAGHYKRYSIPELAALGESHKLKIDLVCGLTYPVSNWLLPISNHIIRKAESGKKKLTMHEQTVQSGNRKVMFKTDYPMWMRMILNKYTMWPFHVLQKLFRNSSRSLILYSEFIVTR